jgi:hypothetical protein
MSKTSTTKFEFTQEGFQALVAKVLELESKLATQTSRTVSPPPGTVVNDRSRSDSSESNSSELSSLEELTGDSSILTKMPCKPKYGEIVCSALLDGWLIHGSTYDHKDMIKANGAKWFGTCKGWALNNKTAVGRILKKINIPKKLEKVQNSFENLGLRFYKPVEKKKVQSNVTNFLDTKNNAGTRDKDACMIEDSDDDDAYDDQSDSLDMSDGEEEE